MKTSRYEQVDFHKVDYNGHSVVITTTDFLTLTSVSSYKEEFHDSVRSVPGYTVDFNVCGGDCS